MGGGWLEHGSEARIVSEDRGCLASVSCVHAHMQVFGRIVTVLDYHFVMVSMMLSEL